MGLWMDGWREGGLGIGEGRGRVGLVVGYVRMIERYVDFGRRKATYCLLMAQSKNEADRYLCTQLLPSHHLGYDKMMKSYR